MFRNEKMAYVLLAVCFVAVAALLFSAFRAAEANQPLTLQIRDKPNGERECGLMLPKRDNLEIEVHRCITNPDGSRSATISFTDKSPPKEAK